MPHCSSPCGNHGVCAEPDKCECDFHWIGAQCDVECECNKHSNCESIDKKKVCVDCQNNTMVSVIVITFMSSPSCHHFHIIIVMSSSSYHHRHIITVMSSPSYHHRHVIIVLRNNCYNQMHIETCISKTHFCLKVIFSRYWIDMITLHNMSKFHSNRIIRCLLNMQFVNITHIKMRRYFDQFFVSPEHLRK